MIEIIDLVYDGFDLNKNEDIFDYVSKALCIHYKLVHKFIDRMIKNDIILINENSDTLTYYLNKQYTE